jgi:hypothetical protein
MKMKFGAIVVAGSGKIGGHVASKNRGGAYLRTKVTPVNPNTASQATVRTRLAGFSQDWKALTQAQRDAWNAAVQDFARTDIFGDIRNPTGFNLYQRLNNNLAQIGVAALTTPPGLESVDQVTIGTLILNLTGPVGTLATSAAVPTGMTMVVDATPSLSPGVSFVKSEYRRIQTFAAAAASPHNIYAAYIAKFGAPVEGMKVFARISFINTTTGQSSPYQSTSAIVTNA